MTARTAACAHRDLDKRTFDSKRKKESETKVTCFQANMFTVITPVIFRSLWAAFHTPRIHVESDDKMLNPETTKTHQEYLPVCLSRVHSQVYNFARGHF